MDSIEKLEKIKLGVYRICSALVSITEHECCCYGFSEEVDMLMEGKSVEEIIAFMDENERTLAENPFARKSRKVACSGNGAP